MKTTLQILTALILITSTVTWGQAVGDYGSAATNNAWNTASNWIVCVTEGTWTGATTATVAPTSATNVWIRNGHTVTLPGSGNILCNNLYVENGGSLVSANTAGSPRYVRVYGTIIQNNGTLGGSNDGLSIGFYTANQTYTFSGNGSTYYVSRLQPNVVGVTIVFDANVNVIYAGSGGAGSSAIYNNGQDNLTVTINAGKTVTMASLAYISVATSGSADPSLGYNITLNVNGTLTTGTDAHINLRNASGKTSTLNVNGTLNFGGNIVAGGTATINVNVNNGGSIAPVLTGKNIDFSGTGTTLTVGTTGAITVGSNNFLIGNPIQGTPANISAGATSSFTIAGTVSGVNIPSSVTNLNNLTVNNANGTTLQGNLTLSGTLTLTNGKLTLGANNLTANTISGASATNYIVTNSTGSLIRNVGASDVSFPVGLATSYLPVVINEAGDASNFNVRVESGNGNPINPDQALQCAWIITKASGTANAAVTFQWNASDEGSSMNRSSISIWKEDGGSWIEVGSGSASGSDPYTFSGTINSFSKFTVGNLGMVPVELTSFIASAGKYDAMLSWKVATEVNAYGYEILRREVGRNNIANVGFVRAEGKPEYSFSDANVKPGNYIYQLKQVDNDGTFKIYSSSQVTVGAAAMELTLGSYPNPFNPTTNIEFTLPENGFATLKVFNIIGQEVATLFSGNVEAGIYNKVSFNASHLSSGMYFSVLEANNQRLVKKLMLTK